METLFDYAASKQLRDDGMTQAAKRRSIALMKAKIIAYEISKLNGNITADDVRKEYEYRGGNWSDLGNAAGSIFKGKQWECVGFENSKVTTSHARALRVWRLKSQGESHHRAFETICPIPPMPDMSDLVTFK